MRVCVLERRDVVGGAAVTEEFHPGYRNSIFSYVVSLLRPEVVRDLELERYGYEPLLLENSLYLDSRGDYLLLNGDEAHDRAQFTSSRRRTTTPTSPSRRRWSRSVTSSPSSGCVSRRSWPWTGSATLFRACAWARTSTVWTRTPAGA
jgi:phytoene dehydrogenase-like protein